MGTLPASLTIRDARAALRGLESSLGEGDGVLSIDASTLKSFDTSAIATLLELRRQAQAVGRTLAVTGAPPAMIELAGLYGVADLLGFESGDQSSARA